MEEKWRAVLTAGWERVKTHRVHLLKSTIATIKWHKANMITTNLKTVKPTDTMD